MTPTFASLLTLILLTQAVFAVPSYFYDGYPTEDFQLETVPSDGEGLSVDRLLQGLHKRSCLRRGWRCDQRPDDCCSGGACRCNLWGTNCQCQRMGLFQKWG